MSASMIGPSRWEPDLRTSTGPTAYFNTETGLGVLGRGATVERAFVTVAEAVFALMTDPSDVHLKRVTRVTFDDVNAESALSTWISRLLIEAETQRLALSVFEVRRIGERWFGTAWGETLAPDAVKVRRVLCHAPTACSLSASTEGWEARCVVELQTPGVSV